MRLISLVLLFLLLHLHAAFTLPSSMWCAYCIPHLSALSFPFSDCCRGLGAGSLCLSLTEKPQRWINSTCSWTLQGSEEEDAGGSTGGNGKEGTSKEKSYLLYVLIRAAWLMSWVCGAKSQLRYKGVQKSKKEECWDYRLAWML